MNIVRRVAIGADGHVRVAFGEQFPVHAGLVLAELIGPQRGIERAHVRSVGMALPTQQRYLHARDVALESCSRAHRLLQIIAGWIAAVATGAIQTLLRMDA